MSSFSISPLVSTPEFQEFRGDELSAFDCVPADEFPTDAEMQSMHAEDCRRNEEPWAAMHERSLSKLLAMESEEFLVRWLDHGDPHTRDTDPDYMQMTPETLARLIVSELAFRSGGAVAA